MAEASGSGGFLSSLAGPAMALGGSLFGGITSMVNNDRNLAYQREAQQSMKDLQEETWRREDNAVQRRRRDLELAGFSPTLAAGNAAQAGSPVKIEALHSENPFEGAMGGMMRAAQTQQTLTAIDTAKSQNELLKAQRGLTEANTRIANAEAGLYQGLSHPKYQKDSVIGSIKELIGYLTSGRSKPLKDFMGKAATSAGKAAIEGTDQAAPGVGMLLRLINRRQSNAQ